MSTSTLPAAPREHPDTHRSYQAAAERATKERTKRSAADDFREATWLAHAQNAARHTTQHGAFPAPANAQSSGQWLATQCAHDQSGKVPARRRALLDQILPGWRDSAAPGEHTLWTSDLDDAIRARTTPHLTTRSERGRVAIWLRRQVTLHHASRLSAQKIAALNTRLPTWREHGPSGPLASGHDATMSLDERWAYQLTLAAQRVQEEGGLPPDGDPSLNWVTALRTAAAQDRVTPERLAAADAAIPGWRTLRAPRAAADAKWLATLHEAAAAVRGTGTLPPSRTAAYKWVISQRRRAAIGTLTAAERAHLGAQIPGWRTTPTARQHATALAAA